MTLYSQNVSANKKRRREVSNFLRQRLIRWLSVLGLMPMEMAISFKGTLATTCKINAFLNSVYTSDMV